MCSYRKLAVAAFAFLLGVPLATAAHAETRVALVIGNGAYASPIMPRLPNPPHDAVAIGNSLKALGFEVDVVTDATKQTMDDALARLARKARDADVTLIFYAGHGLQDQGKNYFAPVDATLSDETDLRRRFVRLDDVLDDLAGAKGARILLLDACRDNGAVEALRTAVPKSRSAGISRGLARIPEAEGQLVAFATQPNRVAADGEGADSPFATALMAHLGEPGVELRTALTRVRVDVARATNNDQIPEVSDSLLGEIYLQPASAAVPKQIAVEPVHALPATPSPDEAAWRRIVSSTDPVDFESFARVFPDSAHKTEADAKGKSLRPTAEPKVAALEPAPSLKPEPPVPPACDGGLVASIGNAGVAAAAQRCLKPKDVFRDCENCPEMVVLPAGSFIMGSPASEKGRTADEGPQHEVRIGAPFAVGKLEITRGQFAAFVNDTGYKPGGSCWIATNNNNTVDTKGRSFRDPGFKQDDSYPAVCISWDNAKAYLSWLAETTGKGYRLLSEAEYEYAARAGSTSTYFFGNDPNQVCGYANLADQTTKAQFPNWKNAADCKDGYVYTAPAGSFAANDFGLYDMTGNVWEWVEDCYHESYNGAPKDGLAWTSVSCKKRVIRGGAWYVFRSGIRAACRASDFPVTRDEGYGFRVARTL